MTETIEPVTLDEVRQYLSVLSTDASEDVLIMALVASCRDEIEQYMSRGIAQAERSLEYTAYNRIYLPDRIEDLIEVIQIGKDGTAQDMTAVTDVLADDSIHIGGPIDMNSTMVVRYVNSLWCPPSVKVAILMAVKNLYMDRQADPLTDEVKSLLRAYKKVRV